jgi:hypothetical protein
LLFDVFFPDAFPLDFLLPFDSLFASPSASVDCLFAGAAYFAALIDMCMCTSCACIVAQKRIKHFFSGSTATSRNWKNPQNRGVFMFERRLTNIFDVFCAIHLKCHC